MSRFHAFPVAELPLGAKLGCAVFDDNKTKLLSAGVAISRQLVQALRQRSVSTVVVSSTDLARLQAFRPQGASKHALPDRPGAIVNAKNGSSEEMDQGLTEWLKPGSSTIGPQFANKVQKQQSNQYEEDWVEQLVSDHQSQIDNLDRIGRDVLRGGSEEVGAIIQGCPQILDRILNDPDAFACLGANPSGSNYPGRHSLHAAMLAIAIGTSMGLDEEQLMNIAIGCLVHDMGMLEVDPYVLQSRKVLEPEEFVNITRHPIRTFDILEKNLDEIPAGARMVAYQMHERMDGTGYPRRRVGTTIHLLARVAAVADAFVALVAPRPHRRGMLPYHAMAKILKDTSAGKFDPTVVRHLLLTISLFPLGSFIELNNNRVGRVLRAGEKYDRPIIELWDRGEVDHPGAVVDLSHDADVQIVRPLVSLA